MKKIIYFFIITMLVSVMLISIVNIHKDYSEDKKQEEVYEELISITKQTKEDTQADTKENIINNDTNETTKEVNYVQIFNKNSDMVGWIKIENTNINYPVMQTRDRPNYYLNRNFYKEYSAWRNTLYTRKL